MDRKIQKGRKAMWILKALLASYVITAVLLVVLAMLLYKFELNEQMVSGTIVGIYVVSTFAGGFITGKLAGTRRFLWGMCTGFLYFALLLLITLLVYRGMNGNSENLLTTFLLCAGGGMAGGMIS